MKWLKNLIQKKFKKQEREEMEKNRWDKEKNKSQDGKFKPNHNNNHVKCKWSKQQVKMQRLCE